MGFGRERKPAWPFFFYDTVPAQHSNQKIDLMIFRRCLVEVEMTSQLQSNLKPRSRGETAKVGLTAHFGTSQTPASPTRQRSLGGVACSSAQSLETLVHLDAVLRAVVLSAYGAWTGWFCWSGLVARATRCGHRRDLPHLHRALECDGLISRRCAS